MHGPLLMLVLPTPAPNRCTAGPAAGMEGTGRSPQMPAMQVLVAVIPKLANISLTAL